MGLFGWLKKAPEIKKAEFVSPATGKIFSAFCSNFYCNNRRAFLPRSSNPYHP